MALADDKGIGIKGWLSGQKPQTKKKESKSEEAVLDKQRIAVLPFSNLSPNSRDEYFADGITEEIISTISNISKFSVISRTSAMSYKGTKKKIEEIARELKAGSVLEGSVRKAGNKLRITVQLINARSDLHVWAQSYDRELKDIFAVQCDIAKQVANALMVEIFPNETRQIEKRPTKNPEAYTLYLKGRNYWNQRTLDNNEKAVKYFEDAIGLDLNYAHAYAGLADCHLISGDYGWMEPWVAFPKAKDYATRALEINPRLAEPHATLGVVYNSYEARWKESEEEFKQAIELKPSYATAYMWYGLLLLSTKRFREGYFQVKKAGELDPLSWLVKINLASALLYMGEVTEAIEQLEKLDKEDAESVSVHIQLGLAYWVDSRTDESIAELRKAYTLSGGDTSSKSELACMLGFAGSRAEASRLLGELDEFSKTKYFPKIKLAKILFGLGKTDEGFAYLNMAREEKSANIDHGSILLDIMIFPWFEEARRDPRWADFERSLGLPQ